MSKILILVYSKFDMLSPKFSDQYIVAGFMTFLTYSKAIFK